MVTGNTIDTEHVSLNTMDRRLEYLLEHLREIIDADTVYLCISSPGYDSINIVATVEKKAHLPKDHQQLVEWMKQSLRGLSEDSQPRILNAHSRNNNPYQSRLIIPLLMPSEIKACLFIFSAQTEHFTQNDLDQIRIPVDIVLSVLENDHLIERLMTTEAIATTAQAIARQPYPQSIVHILRDYLFERHVTFCAIALYGPYNATRPGTSFDYIEIRADWSRKLGSQMITGTRFETNQLMELNDALQRQEFVQIKNQGEDLTNLNDFSRVLLKNTDLRSMVLIPLESRERRLGLLIIGSDQLWEFNWFELRSYQIVSEFLTISTMSEALQREHDFVQQGRAALLEAVSDGVVMTLPNEHANVLTANMQFRAMFQLSIHDLQGKSLWTIIESMSLPESVRHELLRIWQNIDPKEQITVKGEFTVLDTQNHRKDIQWYSAPVFQQSMLLGRIYTFHDVTAERAEENLRYELLSRISHELRTPLTSIQGFAEFILSMGTDLPDTAREYTEIIHHSAKHLNTVYNDLIEFTRANVGEIDLYMTTYTINDVLQEVTSRSSLLLKERQQTVNITVEHPTLEANFDLDRTSQILSNLLNNACKYAPKESVIHMDARLVQTFDNLPENAPPHTIVPCLLISVIDEGKGISEADINQIFLPFYRTRDAQARQIDGSGLGLAISRSLAELQRGKLWASVATEDEPGGRFYFTLPENDILNPQ